MRNPISLKPLRVLLVEDVDEMREALILFLKHLSSVQVLASTRNVWEARLAFSRNRPDLVFLDEVLPGESSLDLLQEFYLQGVPVILLTSLEDPPSELPLGAWARWVKPGWKTYEAECKRFENGIKKLKIPRLRANRSLTSEL